MWYMEKIKPISKIDLSFWEEFTNNSLGLTVFQTGSNDIICFDILAGNLR
jgi:hypothetical protein